MSLLKVIYICWIIMHIIIYIYHYVVFTSFNSWKYSVIIDWMLGADLRINWSKLINSFVLSWLVNQIKTYILNIHSRKLVVYTFIEEGKKWKNKAHFIYFGPIAVKLFFCNLSL